MSAYLKIFIESASFFGNSYAIAATASLSMLAYLLISGYVKDAVLFFAAVLGIFYSVLLKNIFKVPRPDTYVGDPSKLGDMYGFPSSHVVFYVCIWGFVLFLTFKKGVFEPSWVMWVIRILSIYHILFVGLSRVLLGAHTTRDVIAGYLFGALYLSILITLSLVWNKK